MSELTRNSVLKRYTKEPSAVSPVADGAITTFEKDQPLEQIRPGEVLGVNWERVKLELLDIITRIQQEGELETADIAEAILLVTTALRALADEQNDMRERVATLPSANIFVELLALLPIEAGQRARNLLEGQALVKQRAKDVAKLVKDVGELRQTIASSVDESIHRKLLREDPEYVALVEENDRLNVIFESARAILKDLTAHINIMGVPTMSLDSISDFYRKNNCSPPLRRDKAIPSELKLGIGQFAFDLEQRLTRLNERAVARRDEVKRTIYGRARTASPGQE